jgi:hypothetical protein
MQREWTERRRAGGFLILLLVVTVVSDGFFGRPGPIPHQLLLLPGTAVFLVALVYLLWRPSVRRGEPAWTPLRSLSYWLRIRSLPVICCGYRRGPELCLQGFASEDVPA